MEMVSVPMKLPKGMVPYLSDTERDRSFERNAMMLYPYIQDLTISHGKAADILGVNKLDLIDFYCGMGLPYLNQSISDLEEALADFHRMRGNSKEIV